MRADFPDRLCEGCRRREKESSEEWYKVRLKIEKDKSRHRYFSTESGMGIVRVPYLDDFPFVDGVPEKQYPKWG